MGSGQGIYPLPGFRRYLKGDLMQLRETLRSLADLVLSVEQHEALADLDEDEYIQRIETMRRDLEKGNRIAKADQELTEATLVAAERRDQEQATTQPGNP